MDRPDHRRQGRRPRSDPRPHSAQSRPSPGGPAWQDAAIVDALDVSVRAVERIRETWATEGLERALSPRPARALRRRRLDGVQEANLMALNCSAPPAGRASWTMRLLADRLVEWAIVDGIAPETVRHTLKKTRSSPG